MKYMITVLAGCAAALAAQAQPMPPQPNTPAYKACMAEEGALRPQRQAIARRFHEHEAALQRAAAAQAAHTAAQARVDSSDAAAVAAFNTRQDALNAQSESLNAEGARLEKEQDAFNARVAAGNVRCGNILAPYKVRKKEK
ncbi:hypothetical protein GTP41_14300 [Pseudoduganella sp. DS3]|uniref:Uncharacterized protein n=1 Tax=Pseudoduganella guangdongensis TaxID=2692179 RepID=A0A6N9HKL7_9BURK|nr:hypothetical protein [Pseudoduganella guangdongensis]MYN03265.1 hypothetical protein [Pseudoduganella guangdongensis]